jgi:hypothetical protein
MYGALTVASTKLCQKMRMVIAQAAAVPTLDPPQT